MDLRTRPFYTVRALKRLSKLPAPPPCLEAPATPAALAPAPVPVQAAAAPAHATPPASVAQPAPATAPSAPVRVVATAPAPAKTTAPVSPPPGRHACRSCGDSYSGPGRGGCARLRPATAADGPREARPRLRLDGVAMSADIPRRIAPWRDGQGLLTRAAFTRGACVGYTTHHEGVRHVARCAAGSAAKGRGPPVGTR